MKKASTRWWRRGIALAAVGLFLALTAVSADARATHLRWIKVANGSDATVKVIKVHLTLPKGSRPMTIPEHEPGEVRRWKPPRCTIAKSVTMLMCLEREKHRGLKKRKPVVISSYHIRYPGTDEEEKELGRESIKYVTVLVGQRRFGQPSAQAVIYLSDGRMAVRSFVRLAKNPCKPREPDVVPPDPEPTDTPDEPHPFVRIRLKNATDKETEAAEARGYYHTGNTATETHKLPWDGTPPNPPSMPIPPPAHDYDAPGASTPGELHGIVRANQVWMCVRLDPTDMGGNNYFTGHWYMSDESDCRIKRVDFEVLPGMVANTYKVMAYIVFWREPIDDGAECGLTPDDDLPDSHKGLPVVMMELEAGAAATCVFKPDVWPPEVEEAKGK